MVVVVQQLTVLPVVMHHVRVVVLGTNVIKLFTSVICECS
jgi:hypothetical protein